MKDSTASIIRSGMRFFSGTMLSRVTGLVRDVSMAAILGSQPSVAALMVAYRFSNLLRRLFGEGALHSAFIPQFESIRREDPRRAARFFRDLSLSLMTFLFLVTLCIEGLIVSLLAFVEFSPGNREILYLTSLMFPATIFICHFGLNSSLLHCEKRFFTSGIAPVAFNLTWISVLFFLKDSSVEQAVSGLAVGIVGACVLQWLVTVPYSRGFVRSTLDGSLWQGTSLFSKDVMSLGKPLALGLMGVAASQVNSALDAVFARFADLEGPAYLWYAIRIQQAPLGMFGLALAGTLLPPLSRAIKRGDTAGFLDFLDFAFRNCIGIMLPATFGAFILGASGINLLYVRENFTDGTASQTLLCLWGYLPGLIPTALVTLVASASYAKGDYRSPMQASVLAVAVNVILNAVMVFVFGMGAISVALATSASAWVNLLVLSASLRKRDPSWKGLFSWGHVFRVGGCCLLASLCAGGFGFLYWGDNSLLMLFQDMSFPLSRIFALQLSYFTTQSLCFLVVLFGAAKLLRVEIFRLK
ncbi:MAG: putative peptidoglycan lipid II flippase [Chlamydiales bacterium]|jgi:putative peptidoglycan lipid II flippase